MSDSSRRGFLKVAGAGAAAAGVAVVVVAQADGTSSATTVDAAALPASAKREMLVHVRDVHTGAISLMVEGREVTVHDRDLATRIAGAMHSATSV
jgi:hypothetical protein